jgi:chromosome partitioning protein
MIILIGGEKGGTGKTTLATNLAALRRTAGRDVLLVDTDIQGSASYWAARRDENTAVPRVSCIQKFGKGLQAEIQDLGTRYEDVVIDAGGRDSVELRAALVVAEKVYVPIQPSQFDIWTLARMDELVETGQGFNPNLVASVIICRASPNPVVSESAEATEAIRDFSHLRLASSVVRDRIAFRRAVREGLAVNEVTPSDAKARLEIETLYNEVFDGQQEQTKQQAAG